MSGRGVRMIRQNGSRSPPLSRRPARPGMVPRRTNASVIASDCRRWRSAQSATGVSIGTPMEQSTFQATTGRPGCSQIRPAKVSTLNLAPDPVHVTLCNAPDGALRRLRPARAGASPCVPRDNVCPLARRAPDRHDHQRLAGPSGGKPRGRRPFDCITDRKHSVAATGTQQSGGDAFSGAGEIGS